MSSAKPKLALQLLDTELAKFVNLLSHEAAGIALRILDAQHRTGLGLPDGKNTHSQLGLQNRRWQILREELLRVMTVDDGYIKFQPIMDRKEKTKQIRKTAAKTKAAAKQVPPAPPATSNLSNTPIEAIKPAAPKQTAEPAAGHTADLGDPISPFQVLDAAQKNIAATPNVVPIKQNRGSKPQQQSLPGIPGPAAPVSPEPSEKPLSLRHQIFDEGIRFLMRHNGLEQADARKRIGKLLTEWDDHFVHAAIAEAIQLRDKVANPWGWIRNRMKSYPDKATSRAANAAKASGKKAAPAQKTEAPKATAQFMGISAEKAARLRKKEDALRSRASNAATPALKQEPDTKIAANGNHRKTDDQIFRVLAY